MKQVKIALMAGLFASVLVAGRAAVAADPVVTEPVPEVKFGHPRMFFNRETWPQIDAFAKGAGKEELAKLLAECEAMPADPVCTGTTMPPPMKRLVNGELVEVPYNGDTPIPDIRDWGREAAKCALAWRFTGQGKYLESAKRMIRENGRAYNECYRNGRAVSWYSFGRINTLAAYDWIYEALTETERRELILPLLQHVEEALRPPKRIHRRDGSTWNGGCYGVPSLAWYAGLAAVNDGICDEQAAGFLREGWITLMKMVKFRAEGAGDDGALSGGVIAYSLGEYPYAHFNFFHTALSACGLDLPAQYPAMALFPHWVWWTWIPNADSPVKPFYAGLGDTYHGTGRMEAGLLYEHMLQYALVFQKHNPAAARLAMALAERAPKRSVGESFPIYRFLLDPTRLPKAYSAEELESTRVKARHFESLGQFDLRSGWRPGDTFATFSAGARLWTHKHNDENSFVIFKHDFLALDTGSRGNQTDYNLKHYYSQTVAHNTILIHKAGEPLPFHWGLQLKDPKYNWNYGGQLPVSATVKAFETNDDYTYIASDAAKCYGAKCKRALRQLVHVQPDYFIVYDRVENDDDYRTEFLLHTENEPKVEGRMMCADSRGGRLMCETLLPADAVLAKVGGPGKEYWANGRNWEIDAQYLKTAAKICADEGRGPYFGQWRLEVRPENQTRETHFLHVLTATDSHAGRSVDAQLLKQKDREGVALILPSGKRMDFLFNASGEPGGEVVINGCSRPLSVRIQPQSGVIVGK